MVHQIFDVGVALEKPKEFMDDPLEEDLPGCHQRETFRKIESQLSAEEAFRPGARPVVTEGSRIQNLLQQAKILLHRGAG